MTIADLQLFFEATDLILMKVSFDKYPNLTNWYNKVSENPAVKAIQDKWSGITTPLIDRLNNATAASTGETAWFINAKALNFIIIQTHNMRY